MAASALTVQEITRAGVAITAAPANGEGNFFTNSGNISLRVINGGTSPITVTIHAQAACDQGTKHNLAVTVDNGATKEIGPFPMRHYNDASGYVQVTYSTVASVTVAAVKLAS